MYKVTIWAYSLQRENTAYVLETILNIFHTAEKLLLLKEAEWNDFLQQLCQLIDFPEKTTGATRAKLNLLCYLCTIVGNKEAATKLIKTQLVSNLACQEPVRLAQS